ncbi:hypothetical protein F4778DRAFT_513572 [Xylariomycetidae sp. FL2044]|nr:hypothetical protein F4778DRAFT_513572 [Xylariomycetidae sp. FL2044]
MTSTTRSLWVFFTCFALRACAACVSYGIDYSNGGSYNIDSSSNEYFKFTTVFQGCVEESITPYLIGPDENRYACTAIKTAPQGEQVTSTCGIPYSSMASGTWKIILSGQNIGVQRTISLAVGSPETITVTITPTVIIGITSTPPASTIYQTLTKTYSYILVPQTVTTPCSAGGTKTITASVPSKTEVQTWVITKTITDQTTKYYATTVTQTAYCHYQTKTPDQPRPTFCIGTTCQKSDQGDSGAFVPDQQGISDSTASPGDEVVKDVAATTVTITAITTVTSTSVTQIPAETTTENTLVTTTAVITPPPKTVCNGASPPKTITITRPTGTITQTEVKYTTSHVEKTVWVGETKYTVSSNQASATACWRAGGWFGA